MGEATPAQRLRSIRELAERYLSGLYAKAYVTEYTEIVEREIVLLQTIIRVADLGLLGSSPETQENSLRGISRISDAWSQVGFSPEFIRLHAIENLHVLLPASTAEN